jgi:NAD-dependent deacetylase
MGKKKLVVLTGAGISAESGLKTFRDSDGLWEGYNIEDVATPRAWKKDPALVLDFYNMRRRAVREAMPNAAHLGIAALEKDFDVQVITQNIDDLHERAGSSNILHLHGEILKMRSVLDDNHIVPIMGDIHPGDTAPDGGQYRPHIVWFEEPVPMIEEAARLARAADIFVVVGTSLAVYPAAGLVHYAPYGIPMFVVDRSIPYINGAANLIAIEMPATEGIRVLQEKLAGITG